MFLSNKNFPFLSIGENLFVIYSSLHILHFTIFYYLLFNIHLIFIIYFQLLHFSKYPLNCNIYIQIDIFHYFIFHHRLLPNLDFLNCARLKMSVSVARNNLRVLIIFYSFRYLFLCLHLSFLEVDSLLKIF